MNRRSFLTGLGALVGGVLLDQAIPGNRVWSFPSKPVCLNVYDVFRLPLADEVFKTSPVLDRLTGLYYFQDIPDYIGPYMGLSREGVQMPKIQMPKERTT